MCLSASAVAVCSLRRYIKCSTFTFFTFTADPRLWTKTQVLQWLNWAIHEFSLENVVRSQFCLSGARLLQLTRDEFMRRAPPFVGDILFEHLEVLQKGNSKHVTGSRNMSAVDDVCLFAGRVESTRMLPLVSRFQHRQRWTGPSRGDGKGEVSPGPATFGGPAVVLLRCTSSMCST